MVINPGIFRDYDVRALIPQELDGQGAVRIGQAIGSIFKPKTVAIGHDMRLSAPEIAGGLMEGITLSGAEVIDLGLISTDLIYFAAGKFGYDLAISVSASHNPGQYNGFKIVKKGAVPVSGESGVYSLRDLAVSSKEIKIAPTKGQIIKKDLTDDFIAHCLKFADYRKIKPFKVVIDAGNGMAGYFIPKFEPYLPLQIIPLYFELDGSFPHHLANPLIPENVADLKKKIIEEKADMGLAFDGDADRVYFLDEKANFINGTVLTAMIAEALLKKKPGQTVLYNAVTGRVVPQVVEELGGKAIRVRVGHTLIKEDMRKYDALFAGEHSGHYYYRENYYSDSGFITMLIAMELISLRNNPLSTIVEEFDKYPSIPETNFEVENKDKVIKVIEKTYQTKANKIDWLDGLTLWFSDGWVNIRLSNTQPLLRLNIEADNSTILVKRKREFISLIESFGGKISKD